MRILITGATGFIGRHLVKRLAADHEIYALVRKLPMNADNADGAAHDSVHYIEQDLTEPLALTTFPAAVDAIIHQAAVIDTDTVEDAIPFLVNVVATWRLLAYAETAQVQRFVYASTGGVYGCRNQPFREGDPLNPMDLYSLTKAQAELAVQAAPGNFQRIILRYFYPYGVGTPNPIPRFVRHAVTGTPIQIPEGGGPRFNPIHIDDTVEATVRALYLTNNHIVNIAGNEVTTFAEIAQIAAQFAGQEAQLATIPLATTIPYYRADLVAATDCMAHLLNFQPAIPLRAGLRSLAYENRG
ncbi:MAG: NAD(P)-dependent oxidoreductase [Caldilineaceae bacterium]